MYRDKQGWIRQYVDRGAFWLHGGKPIQPHALLTSGRHSNGFFNSDLVMEDSLLLDEACSDLVELLEQHGVDLETVDRVMGPAMGAITLSHDLTRHIARRSMRTSKCIRGYTEKHQKVSVVVDGTKITTETSEVTMFFERGTPMRVGEHILADEDVLTTGETVERTAAAIRAQGGIPMPYVAVIVNRSGLKEADGRKIIALIDEPMPMWEPADCPLCKQGSRAIRPKGENWKLLTAEY